MSKIALLFLLTFYSGIMATIVIDGAWGFYLYQLVYFLNPGFRWWSSNIPDLSYSFTVVFCMILAFFYRFKNYKDNKLFSAPQTKWMVAILCMYAVVQIYAINPMQHWKALVDLAKLFIVMALAYKMLDTPKKLEYSLWAFLIGCTYIGWEAYNVGRNEFGRVEGIGTVDSPDANGIAAAIAPAASLLIFFAWQGSIKTKAAIAFMSIWIINALVLINSRGAFLAVIVGGGYFISNMIFNSTRQKNQRLIAIVVIVCAVGGALYLTDDIFWARMGTMDNIEDEGASGSHRYHMWLATFDVISDYPGGVGAYGFQALSPHYIAEWLFGEGETNKAIHSSWFQSLAEMGWLGPILICGLLISCFHTTRSVKRIAKVNADIKLYYKVIAIEGGLLSYMVAGSFIDQIRAQILYWMILFTACLYNIYLSENRHKLDLLD